jgi:hypothetical protein
MTDTATNRIIYIAGYGRSGSTLLDIALGEHRSVFGAGEVSALTRHVWAQDEYCACGSKVRSCPLWSRIVGSWRRGRTAAISAFASRQDSLESIISWRRLFGNEDRPDRLVNRALFEEISKAADRPMIVDSSKLPGRGFSLASTSGIELFVVHMVRDPRAVIWSMMKPINRQLEAGVQRDLTPKPLLRTALRWMVVNLSAEILRMRVPRDHSIRVRYEDFVADPRGTLSRILELAGENADQLPDGLVAPLHPAHQVAGSRHRMQKELLIRADHAWRSAMPVAKQRIAAFLCAPLLWRYGYSWRRSAPASLEQVLA